MTKQKHSQETMKQAERKPASKGKETAQEAAPLSVSYPKEGERVTSKQYTFCIEAPEIDRVEVSIDGNDWQPCRPAVGYWWYDWSGYMDGQHDLVARSRNPKGEESVSAPRRFKVEQGD